MSESSNFKWPSGWLVVCIWLIVFIVSTPPSSHIVLVSNSILVHNNNREERNYAQQTLPPFDPTDNCAKNSSSSSLDANLNSAVESLFGQVAKTVVYGSASVLRFNSRLLCPLLSRETERDNEDQPTLFVFNNPNERERAFRIYADDQITSELVQEAQFDANQMTVILVHGWLGGVKNELWLTESRNVALQLRNLIQLFRDDSSTGSNVTTQQAPQLAAIFRPNVIVVDWSEFAHGSLFSATQNSYKVSRRLASLLEQLAHTGHLKPQLMHCLGHSIGAHICGQAARQAFPPQARHFDRTNNNNNNKQIPKRRMGRITGLDPGGFCYELSVRNETKFKGLRPSDALLVDAYYSNRSPFGNKYQVAQYNVRLSNGYYQRPCSVWRQPEVATEYFRAAVRFLLGNIGHNDILTCDHYFATRFAHKSLPLSCSFVGFACDSYRSFSRGRCGNCNSAAQCYTMDFEWQKSQPTVVGALQHISKHSSYLANGTSNELDAQVGQPAGGVPHGSRRVYYMQIGQDETSYCSATYRLRVKLDSTAIKPLSSFRSEWLTLRFLAGGREGEMLNVRDASSGNRKVSDSIRLWGPWEPLFDRNQQVDELTGLDNRTLTGMFELLGSSEDSNGGGQPKIISNIMVSYNNDPANHRRRLRSSLLMANPIESIELDYLGSADARIRKRYSRSFSRQEFIVHYRHLVDEAPPSLADRQPDEET